MGLLSLRRSKAHLPVRMRPISNGDAMIGYTPFGAYRAYREDGDRWRVMFDGSIIRGGKNLKEEEVEARVNRDYDSKMMRAYR